MQKSSEQDQVVIFYKNLDLIKIKEHLEYQNSYFQYLNYVNLIY